MRRKAQPPIDRSTRPTEQRRGWAGVIAGLIALAATIWGAGHVTGIETLTGTRARETQLIKAFANGGLRFSDPAALPAPSILNDPAKAAAAFERLQLRDRKQDKLTYRVDAGAATPCPT